MHVTIAPNGYLQIDDARITYKNFEGRGDMYNREGERNFSVIIPNQEIADALMNEKNKFGVGWKVKIKAPREQDDQPFMHLPVKVKFTDFGPNVYLISGNKRRKLDEEDIGILDKISIQKVDLDIRPYDDEGRFGPFRSAYLHSMEVTQNFNHDRFAARYAEEEYPEE